MVRTFYRQNRDLNSFLRSNSSVSRTNYLRVLALASIDIALTLPNGIVGVVLTISSALGQNGLPFYWGWHIIHHNGYWKPGSVSHAQIAAGGTAELAQFYFAQWTTPVLAFAIFGLFGVTAEARDSYLRIIHIIVRWLGWKPHLDAREVRASNLDDIELRHQDQSISLGSVEMGPWCVKTIIYSNAAHSV